jgi:hypothetical protein
VPHELVCDKSFRDLSLASNRPEDWEAKEGEASVSFKFKLSVEMLERMSLACKPWTR